MAKNIKDLLMGATQFPAAIEAKLPAGAPKISTMLVEATGKIPDVPDFPMEIPDLPAPPEIPALPEFPALGGVGSKRYVSEVEVSPIAKTGRVVPLEQAYTQPIEGVIGTVISRRGM